MNSNISLFQYTFANRSLLFADELSMAWKIIKAICFDEKKKTAVIILLHWQRLGTILQYFLASFTLNLTSCLKNEQYYQFSLCLFRTTFTEKAAYTGNSRYLFCWSPTDGWACFSTIKICSYNKLNVYGFCGKLNLPLKW